MTTIREGWAGIIVILVASCDSNPFLSVSIQKDQVAARPGGPRLPTFTWSPGNPIDRIEVSSVEGASNWSCTSPHFGNHDAAKRLAPPLTYGLTPKTAKGELWDCVGSVGLAADKTYAVSLEVHSDDPDDGPTQSADFTFTGVATPPPPDTLFETSFEDGVCESSIPVDGPNDVDRNYGELTTTNDAHTGSKACRICATKGVGAFYFGRRVNVITPGRHTIEAWVRGTPEALPESLSATIEYFGGGFSHVEGGGTTGSFTTSYAVVRASVDVPPNISKMGFRIAAQSRGCFVVDDVRVMRE